MLAFSLALGLTATASTYTHPTSGDPPTPADLVFIASHSKTLAVQILNLTPYKVDADPSGITALGNTDKNRKTHKSFMFAPIGWPASIPSCPGPGRSRTGTGRTRGSPRTTPSTPTASPSASTTRAAT